MYSMPERRNDSTLMIGIFLAIMLCIGTTVYLVNRYGDSDGSGRAESAASGALGPDASSGNAGDGTSVEQRGPVDAQEPSQTGDHEQALASAERLLESDPSNAEAQFARGNALLGLGRAGESIEAFLSAIEIRPQNPQYRDALGRAYLETGDVEQAVTALREARELDPEDPTIRRNLEDALEAKEHGAQS